MESAKANENGVQGRESAKANENGNQRRESANENGNPKRNRNTHSHVLDQSEGLLHYKCKGCKQFGKIKGYKCRLCHNLNLHEVCAPIYAKYKDPKVSGKIHDADVINRFQFRHKASCCKRCDACKKFLKGFVLESSSPQSRLHPLCAALPEEFTHRGHPHVVTLMKETSEMYKCSQCGKCNYGWRYRCVETTCDVKYCLNCSITSIHEFGSIEVAPPGLLERTLEPVFNGCKPVTGWVMKGFCERLGGAAGTALATPILALCCGWSNCYNNEGGAQQQTADQGAKAVDKVEEEGGAQQQNVDQVAKANGQEEGGGGEEEEGDEKESDVHDN